MDMGFDHAAWPLGQASGAPEGRLDWHGLRARFLAVRACHRVMADGQGAGQAVTDASFDRSAARTLAGFDEAAHDVNQRDSADGKGLSAIDEDVAGASTRGDRG